MSALKKKLARKINTFPEITKSVGRTVSQNDICFHKNGRRNDVIKWDVCGIVCFESGAESIKKGNKLVFLEASGHAVAHEIVVEVKKTS